MPAEKFEEAVESHGAQAVGMSVLLTTTMREMRNTLQAIEAAGLRSRVKVLVGGALIAEGFSYEIGADGYGPDAASTGEVMKSLLASEGVSLGRSKKRIEE